MRAGILSLLVLLFTPPAVAAQTADELIARYIEARGGREKLAAIRSLRIVRTYSTFSVDVPVVILKKRQGFHRVEQTLPGRPPVVRAVTPDGAWEHDGKQISDRPPEVAAEMQELDGDIDGFLVDYREKGHAVELVGRERTGGVDTWHLRVTLKSGAVRDVYLDASTYLERKQTGIFTHPQAGKVPVTLIYSDWREAGGVLFPYAIDEERDMPGGSIAIYTEKIEVNPALDESLFRRPSS